MPCTGCEGMLEGGPAMHAHDSNCPGMGHRTANDSVVDRSDRYLVLGRQGQRGGDAMRRMGAVAATAFAVVASGVLTSVPAQAAPGDLDTSFSGDGRQITDFGGGESGFGVAVQVDGKIVVAGSGDGDFAVARYNLDGSLDTSFSGDC
jgi:Domain of unknown function (DUF5122) beta-propeller